MITGSCLCQSVSIEIESIFYGRYCHCDTCRKFSGTSPAAWAAAERSKFKVVSDTATVSSYYSGKGRRHFCQKCGSPLWYESDEYPEILGIPYGLLDSANLPSPEGHVWLESTPSWCELIGPEMPPS